MADIPPVASMRRVPVIGLIGGIASGKSFVGRTLQELGAVRIDADRLGHELLDNILIRQQLVRELGPEILTTDGHIDRARVSALVFGNDEQSLRRRRRLESVLHPAIHEAAIQQVQTLSHSSPPPTAVVIDAPLLVEAGWDRMCDWVFFVDTPEYVRRQRASQRGWSESHWRDREHTQLDLNRKRQAATHLIPGDLPAPELKQRLVQLLNEMHAGE
ncbi:MAG: dephospho-CoA kinase [Pirellulaceae bacterium]|nr:dephospho-CoA kinase [Pirellulaceae bacterium]